MALQRLSRSTTDRKIAGVAAGVARYFGLDPNLVRVGWVLSVLVMGAGGLLYVVLWAVLPEEPDGLSIGSRRNPAIAVAEERYARGEITNEGVASAGPGTNDELREIRKTLSESA